MTALKKEFHEQSLHILNAVLISKKKRANQLKFFGHWIIRLNKEAN